MFLQKSVSQNCHQNLISLKVRSETVANKIKKTKTTKIVKQTFDLQYNFKTAQWFVNHWKAFSFSLI